MGKGGERRREGRRTAGGGASPADTSALAPDGRLCCDELRERKEGDEAERGPEREHFGLTVPETI